jgi:hypothetical protein
VPCCAWCGRPLPLPKGSGRPRKYCNDSCRYAAKNDRVRLVEGWTAGGVDLHPAAGMSSAELEATVTGLTAGLRDRPEGDAVDRLAAAVIEARVLAAAFGRLAAEPSLAKQLAYRCAIVCAAIAGAIDDAFGKATDGEEG